MFFFHYYKTIVSSLQKQNTKRVVTMPQVVCAGTQVLVDHAEHQGKMYCVHVNVDFNTHRIDSVWVINDKNVPIKIKFSNCRLLELQKNSIIQVMSHGFEGKWQVLNIENDFVMVQNMNSLDLRFIDPDQTLYSILKI